MIDPVTPHIVDAHATSARVADETCDARQCSPPAQVVAVMMKNAPPPGDPGRTDPCRPQRQSALRTSGGSALFADFAPGTDAAKAQLQEIPADTAASKNPAEGGMPVLIDSCR